MPPWKITATVAFGVGVGLHSVIGRLKQTKNATGIGNPNCIQLGQCHLEVDLVDEALEVIF